MLVAIGVHRGTAAMAEFLNLPWNMIGSAIGALVLLISITVNIIKPEVRRWRLRRPCKAYFHIRELEHGDLRYMLQDDVAHNVTELVVPSNTVVEIEVAYDVLIPFHVHQTVFGIDGDLASKPRVEERFTRFIEDGTGKSHWIPGVDTTDTIDRKGNYHYDSRFPGRSVGSCYTMGFKLRTKQAGVYKTWLGFLTDEIDGSAVLSIRVEDTPSTKMKCVMRKHWRCYVRPMFPK